MRKLMAIVAMVALMLVAAAPALADTVEVEVGGVEAEATSVFFGNDTAEAEIGEEGLEAEAVSQFLFFGGGLF